MVAQILSPTQRTALFDPPSDPATIERLYTLGPEDLIEVFRRRPRCQPSRLRGPAQLSPSSRPGTRTRRGAPCCNAHRPCRANRLRAGRLWRLCDTRHDVARTSCCDRAPARVARFRARRSRDGLCSCERGGHVHRSLRRHRRGNGRAATWRGRGAAGAGASRADCSGRARGGEAAGVRTAWS